MSATTGPSSSRRPACPSARRPVPTTIVRFSARSEPDRQALRAQVDALAGEFCCDGVRVVVCDWGPPEPLIVLAILALEDRPRLPWSVRTLIGRASASYSGTSRLGARTSPRIPRRG